MSLSGTEEDYLLEKALTRVCLLKSPQLEGCCNEGLVLLLMAKSIFVKVKSYAHTQPLCLISMKIRIQDFVCHLLCFTAPTVRAAVQK